MAGSCFPAGLRAFTLVELLAVLAIIGVLLAAILPSIQSMEGESFSSSVSDIATLLEQARAYAMAYNTYVYAGVYEADGSQSATNYPQNAGIGRVYIGVAESKDGTNGYSTGTWVTSNLSGINPLRRFDGVHTVPVTQVAPVLTKMDQNTNGGDLDLSKLTAATTFSGTDMGVGASINPVALFSEVIQFTPSGAANVITSLTATSTVPPYIQIDFITSHGNIAESTAANCAGLQIDGITGTVSVFRPGQP
jgi:prepilin-type N-terminal cleavage/methylation domain-containing protein